MAVYELNGVAPTLGRDVFVADSATVVGDVDLGEEASVWFGAVVRGDTFAVRIGRATNVQDNAVIHVTSGKASTTLGDEVTVGHAAVVHGASIGHRCLIGIGSIVLDGASVGDDSLVAAGSLITPGQIIPARSFALGRPARVLRQVTESEMAAIRESAANYVHNAKAFHSGCRRR
jgi:carbonic anhydrase/acetyltransferase-like protein (isoleucine patch superfamily)